MTSEEKQNRMLHAIKKVAYARHQLDEALDELAKEIIRDNGTTTEHDRPSANSTGMALPALQ